MTKQIKGIINIVVTEIEEKQVSVTINANGFFDQQYIKEILQRCIHEITIEPIKN